jgi:hypothetical protein
MACLTADQGDRSKLQMPDGISQGNCNRVEFHHAHDKFPLKTISIINL